MKKYIITKEEYEAVKAAQKKNIHKRQDKLLEAVALRYEGYRDWEIAYKLGWDRQSVSRVIKRFKREGLEAYVKNNYKGNHRNLSEAEEKASLDEVASLAAQGHLVGVEEIRAALEKRLGRKSRRGYVYDVIHRHNWRQVMPRPKHPEAASPEEQETAKKEIGEKFEELKKNEPEKKVRLMFQDEAGFGRISVPKRCWCPPGIRPCAPCLRVREYEYAYGAVDPESGDNFFLIMPYSNTECMNLFLEHLGKEYAGDIIFLLCDNASWHTTEKLKKPENVVLFYIPPHTPEMNPIEQIWKELRTRGFKNEFFESLDKVEERLCEVICALTNETVVHITKRDWLGKLFLSTG